jgi:hypothetical protein
MIDDAEYIDTVSNILSLVKHKVVLELAPFSGWHTSIMLNNGAKKIICVEPNPSVIDSPIYSDPRVNLHISTANDYYKTSRETVDVVTCMGLLYHLHSPLHLLEQIINFSNPEYLIIETVIRNSNITLVHEEYNVPGNAFKDRDITKQIPYTTFLDVRDFSSCICSMGYSLIKHSTHVNQFNHISKRNIEFAVFQRNGL